MRPCLRGFLRRTTDLDFQLWVTICSSTAAISYNLVYLLDRKALISMEYGTDVSWDTVKIMQLYAAMLACCFMRV